MMLPAILFAGIVAADQIVKLLIRAGLAPGESLPVIPGFFKLTYVRNQGAAFSMFENNMLVTVGLTTLLIAVCIVLMAREWRKGSKPLVFCFVMIAAGGVSNLYDRLSAGFVTDMFSFGSFAVFNVADIFIVCGCILAMLLLLFDKEK